MTTATAVARASVVERIPGVGVFARLVGPAALTAGGMIGAGAVATRLLTMTYLCMDFARQDWHFTRHNKKFQVVFALWIAIPALLTPFWGLPALLKAIVAMVGNLLLAPVAVAVIFYFINQRRMGEFRAAKGRNVILAITLVFALVLAVTGVVRFLR